MTLRILLAGALGGAAVALALGACGGEDPAPRPDLLLVSTRDGDYAIYALNADGERQVRLSEEEGDPSSSQGLFFQIEPAWSPDGSRIAFASKRSGSFDIYVMNADGTGTKRLTSTKEDDSHPTWSADGRKIAFARSPGDLFVMDADGSDAHRISNPTVEEVGPAWSPDGKWIAYARRTPGSPIQELWLIRPDGSDPRAVTKHDAVATTPAWSPDSAQIAFSSNKDGELFEVFTVSAEGGSLRKVATTAEGMFEPSWSPDGDHDRLRRRRSHLQRRSRRRRAAADHGYREQRFVTRLESPPASGRRVRSAGVRLHQRGASLQSLAL